MGRARRRSSGISWACCGRKAARCASSASIPSPTRSASCRGSAISPRRTTSPAGCASTSSFATRARSIRPGTMPTRRSCGGRSRSTPRRRSRTSPRGRRPRAGLLIALAYRPELLVLDEPSSGLDPIVRRDILGAVIRTIAHEGRTVLFSSHLLDEVEQVADHVTMISRGTIVLSAPLDAIRESHRVGERVPSLDEIFVARVGRPRRRRRRRNPCVLPLSRSPGNSADGFAWD